MMGIILCQMVAFTNKTKQGDSRSILSSEALVEVATVATVLETVEYKDSLSKWFQHKNDAIELIDGKHKEDQTKDMLLNAMHVPVQTVSMHSMAPVTRSINNKKSKFIGNCTDTCI